MRSPVLFIFSIVFALVQLAGIELKKPNVLLIAVDDLNDWVGCLGGHHKQLLLISIDSQSVHPFSNAHCQGTMCNLKDQPLWGRRPSSTGFYDNRYPILKEPEFLKQHVNLPAHFVANGYTTLSSGKIFHTGRYFQIEGPREGQWRKIRRESPF